MVYIVYKVGSFDKKLCAPLAIEWLLVNEVLSMAMVWHIMVLVSMGYRYVIIDDV